MHTGFENGKRCQKSRNVGGLWKPASRKGRETDSPVKLPESKVSTLILAQQNNMLDL